MGTKHLDVPVAFTEIFSDVEAEEFVLVRLEALIAAGNAIKAETTASKNQVNNERCLLELGYYLNHTKKWHARGLWGEAERKVMSTNVTPERKTSRIKNKVMATTDVLSLKGAQRYHGSSWIDGFVGIPKELVAHILSEASRGHMSTIITLQKV